MRGGRGSEKVGEALGTQNVPQSRKGRLDDAPDEEWKEVPEADFRGGSSAAEAA